MMQKLQERSDEAQKIKQQLEKANERETQQAQARDQLADEQKRITEQMEAIERQKHAMQESFLQEKAEARRLRNQLEDLKGQIRVYVRTRPMNKVELSENSKGSCLTFEDETTVTVTPPDAKFEKKSFSYNRAFCDEDQAVVFEDTRNLIASAIDGYNVCVFAYGQTGSGKTYTLSGVPSNPGVAPRALKEIFSLCAQTSRGTAEISCYMVELYNEQVLDLLRTDDAGSRPTLVIKKDRKGLVQVQGAVEKTAEDHESLFATFEDGLSRRRVRATRMNEASSRYAHFIIPDNRLVEACANVAPRYRI